MVGWPAHVSLAGMQPYHPPDRSPRAVRLLRLTSIASPVVACVLLLAKAWAFSGTGSVAVLSSMADSLLDLMAALITLFAIAYALIPADDEHRFGHGKSEALAALFQVVLIVGSAVFVGREAIARLLDPQLVVHVQVGVAVMLFAMLLTSALLALQYHVARLTGSLALRADAAHYRSDLLSNAAVAVGLLIAVRPGFGWVDAACGLGVAGYIAYSAVDVLRQAVDVLLDRELPDEFRAQVTGTVMQHPQVHGVHDLRTRHSGTARFVQLHLELDPALALSDAHRIGDEIEAHLHTLMGPMDVLIHLDPAYEPASHTLAGVKTGWASSSDRAQAV